MIHLLKLQLHVCHGILQFHVHGHQEKGCLLLVNHHLTLVYECCNVLTFLVKMYQLLLFHNEGRLVLVCVVDISLQVNNVSKRC